MRSHVARFAFLFPLLLVGWLQARAAVLTDLIDVHALDQPLLARAIFEETNRVRAAAKLKAFKSEPKLDQAADTQAQIGSVFQPPSHTNPFPLIATPLDRAKFAGLEPERVAENIALLTIYDVPRTVTFYTTGKDPTLRDSRSGEPLKVQSYASFARAVVAAWMDSPGHRANILDRKLRYLGCAVRPTKSQNNVDMLFAVQAFYTPQRSPMR